MKKITRNIAVAAMSAAIAVTSFVPAQAMPMPTVHKTQVSDVETVQYRRRPREGYYQGHRGYRYGRHGYRRHSDGWWYPLAAFGAGAIIGGAIANQPRRVEGGINPRHVDWCFNRYRSYRSWDNTFQPYGGPRQQCYSPYY